MVQVGIFSRFQMETPRVCHVGGIPSSAILPAVPPLILHCPYDDSSSSNVNNLNVSIGNGSNSLGASYSNLFSFDSVPLNASASGFLETSDLFASPLVHTGNAGGAYVYSYASDLLGKRSSVMESLITKQCILLEQLLTCA